MKNLSVCLYGPRIAQSFFHLLRDSSAWPEHKEKILLEVRAAKLARDGPKKSTRGQKAVAEEGAATLSELDHKSVGRFKPKPSPSISQIHSGYFSFTLELSDRIEFVTAKRRSDCNSSESIVSPKLFKAAVPDVIENFKNIFAAPL